MPSYNLDEDLQEGFDFILGGHEYKMRYPTLEEVQEAQKIKEDSEQLDWVYSYISTGDKSAPAFADAIKTVNTKTVKKFGEMVKEEFYS